MATLNNFLQRGKPRKNQLNIIDIFNIPDLLFQRGFENVTEGTIEETLLDESVSPIFKRDRNYIPDWKVFNDFIDKFSKKKFRIEIRDMVFDIQKSRSPSSSKDYIFEVSPDNEKRYSNTIELLIAYLCVIELKALSASYGVKIKNAPDGGDFDCLANFQNSLIHFEIKSGNIKNIAEDTLQCFLNRHSFLAPDASILFLDYQSRTKNYIDSLILKFRNLKEGPERIIQRISKIQDGSNKFYTLAADLIVVDLHNNNDILSNLRSAVQYFHRYNAISRTMDYLLITPESLGYKYEQLSSED